MDVLTYNYRDILVKKPWYEPLPYGYMTHGVDAGTFEKDEVPEPDDEMYKKVKTQDDFLREYYPTSHSIFDESKYPDILKKGPANLLNPDDPNDPLYGKTKWYVQKIQRTAFAFQQLIAVKHILHLTGNDVQFELASDPSKNNDEMMQNLLTRFKMGWLMADMEIRMYEAVRSLMITADTAIVGFFDEKKKFGAKVLSFINGDKLYPQYNSLTGELEVFARKYYDYDEDGQTKTEWVEVWDDTYYYRYSRSVSNGKVDTLINKIKGLFGVGGYTLVEKKPHGFPFIPVSYMRNDDGPCWHAVQRNIEDYEVAFSYLCENNKAYAFPIFFMQGDGDSIQIQGDMNGAVKAIAMSDPDAKAGFLNGTDASNAFATQLQKSYDLIYELSFTVKPPELKSGDLPGVALKLLYSPALEIAMNDAQMIHPFLSKVVEIVKYGIGYENGNVTDMVNLPVNAWIEPYVHQNNTEIITNLATAVQNNFLSHQTASERCPNYPVNDEYDRIVRETKEKQEQDLLNDIKLDDAQTENKIEENEANAKLNKGQSGSDINTGNGKRGRPNKSGTQYDSNRNWEGRNNWDSYDHKH